MEPKMSVFILSLPGHPGRQPTMQPDIPGNDSNHRPKERTQVVPARTVAAWDPLVRSRQTGGRVCETSGLSSRGGDSPIGRFRYAPAPIGRWACQPQQRCQSFSRAAWRIICTASREGKGQGKTRRGRQRKTRSCGKAYTLPGTIMEVDTAPSDDHVPLETGGFSSC